MAEKEKKKKSGKKKKKEKSEKKAEPAPPPEPGIFDDMWETMFSKSWPMWVGCILLSVCSIVLFLVKSPWGSSGGLGNWGQNLYDAMGMAFPESAPSGVTTLFNHRYALLSVTMLIGALGSALLSKEFAIRVAPKGELVKGLFGGILMGIGCTLSMGCTIGGFFTGWAAMSGAGLIFVLGLFIGVFIAVKYMLWEMEAAPGISGGKTSTVLAANVKGTSLQPLAGVIVLGIGAAFVFQTDVAADKVLIGFVLIGLMIGFILQRSRFCIVRTLRETFLTGDSEPTQGLIAGILVGLFGITVIKIMGIGSETMMVTNSFWIPAIVGGIIFGVGMTIAGGCTVGSTWRSGEGHVKLMLAMVGIVVSMPLAAEYIQPGFMAALPDDMAQKVFLPDTFGYAGGVCLMILILLLWYLFARWNERTGKLTAL